MKELKQMKKLADEFEEAEKFISKQKEPLVQEINKTIRWGEIAEKEMDWEDAKKWCKEQGGRLPTRFELFCVYEDEEIRKTFNTGNYWSSTPYGDYVYYVRFSDCNSGYGNTGNAYSVRCVYDK